MQMSITEQAIDGFDVMLDEGAANPVSPKMREGELGTIE
jgi:hypothetical protein